MNNQINIQVFEPFFPELGKGVYSIAKEDMSDFPIWLRSVLEVYSLNITNNDNMLLIKPKKTDLALDTLLNIYRLVSSKLGPRTILIADKLNPKFRPLLVKFKIPFVYKDKTIFAPNLGIIEKEMAKLRTIDKRDTGLERKLHPLSIKLLSAYLTQQISKQTSLQQLHRALVQLGTSLSLSKLSYILKEMVDFGLMDVIGSGPAKEFRFKEPDMIWDILLSVPTSSYMKVIFTHYFDTKDQPYLLAGESALAEYSDLATPNQLTIAMSKQNYRIMQTSNTKHQDYDEKGLYVQIWNEDPHLFSIHNKINPIELYLSLKDVHDERVQTACEQMLKNYIQ